MIIIFLLILTNYSLYIYIFIISYLHARPVSQGTVQQIMPNFYCLYGSLDT
jgi:hypothetical protein